MKSLNFSLLRRLLVIASLAITSGVLGSSHSAATAVAPGGEEWRAIDPADLALKVPIVEPDADAEALFWDIRVDDGGLSDLVLSHYIRVKIFTNRGRDSQGKIDIPYRSGTKIKDVAARTIKADGSTVELTKEDIIERTVVKAGGVKIKTKSFAFPNIEPGAIIEYKWKEVISNSSANYMRLEFQREIPIESITYHIKPGSGSGATSWSGHSIWLSRALRKKNGFYSTTVKNMPAFHEEPNMPPEDNVRSWAMISYNNILSFFLDYYVVATQSYHSFQPYLKVDDEIRRKSAEITGGATTRKRSSRRSLLSVGPASRTPVIRPLALPLKNEKMKENKKPADTLKRGVGSWMDIDLLFAALARAAGFDARVALLPDRSKRLFDRNVVLPGALRPSTIAVSTGEIWKFFDPGFHYVTPGMLRWQEEAVDALITDESSPFWIKTPLSPPVKSKETRVATLRLDEDGTLEGDVSIESTGHFAVEGKEQNDDDSANQREETLKDGVKSRLSTAEVTNIVIENVTDSAKPLVYKYHVRVPGYAQRTGKRLFLQPAFFEKGIGPLFTTSTRKYPIYFHYPWSEEDKVVITLPKGYLLDNLDVPRPITFGAGTRYDVKIQMTKDDSTLTYSRTFFFAGDGRIYFPVQSYGGLKQFFDEMNKADNHTITLKQNGSN